MVTKSSFRIVIGGLLSIGLIGCGGEPQGHRGSNTAAAPVAAEKTTDATDAKVTSRADVDTEKNSSSAQAAKPQKQPDKNKDSADATSDVATTAPQELPKQELPKADLNSLAASNFNGAGALQQALNNQGPPPDLQKILTDILANNPNLPPEIAKKIDECLKKLADLMKQKKQP